MRPSRSGASGSTVTVASVGPSTSTSPTGNVGVSPRKSRLAGTVSSRPSSGLVTWSGRRLSYSSEISQRPAFGISSSCSEGDPSAGESEGVQPSASAITGGMFQTIAVPLPRATARPSGVSQSSTAPGAVPSSRVRRLPVLPGPLVEDVVVGSLHLVEARRHHRGGLAGRREDVAEAVERLREDRVDVELLPSPLPLLEARAGVLDVVEVGDDPGDVVRSRPAPSR